MASRAFVARLKSIRIPNCSGGSPSIRMAALVSTIARMLLKSWAIPAVSCPTASIRSTRRCGADAHIEHHAITAAAAHLMSRHGTVLDGAPDGCAERIDLRRRHDREELAEYLAGGAVARAPPSGEKE
jgi:hypothetical protein